MMLDNIVDILARHYIYLGVPLFIESGGKSVLPDLIFGKLGKIFSNNIHTAAKLANLNGIRHGRANFVHTAFSGTFHDPCGWHFVS